MVSRFVSAGTSDVGSVRGNNEDRIYMDSERGIYLVVDGMGGQAAGEEAAEIAVKTIKGRLERQTESAEQRVREAIALANNAIFEAAGNNAAWRGMACVLTLALVEDGDAVIGHVGDSRAYQIRGGRIEKITRDHSPVGEREDAGELSEDAAMHHPRRNEVFRDVGSTPRTPDDPDFIDIQRVAIPGDSVLLICSDGLSDVVPSRRILQVIEENAHDCEAAVRTLVRAAVADGKDNVSVVLVEGRGFPDTVKLRDLNKTKPPIVEESLTPPPPAKRLIFFLLGVAVALAALAGYSIFHRVTPLPPQAGRVIHVGPNPGDYPTVPEAIEKSSDGDIIELAPGIYPEKVLMRAGITIRAARPRTATIGGGVVAEAVSRAVLRDLIVSPAGIEVNSSNLRIEGVETTAEIRFTGISTGSIHGTRTSSSIRILDSAAPEIGVNFIGGDIECASSGPFKIEGNAIQGVVFYPSLPPPAIVSQLLKSNLFSAKKPIQVINQKGAAR